MKLRLASGTPWPAEGTHDRLAALVSTTVLRRGALQRRVGDRGHRLPEPVATRG